VPDVRLTKSVSKALNKEGGKFNYTFNVNNLGSLNLGEEGTAFNVIVSDNLPLGVEPTGQYWIEPNGATNGKPQLLSAPMCAFECFISRQLRTWLFNGVCLLGAATALLQQRFAVA
jgi:uncharacterized repeat protein (TIGR01451 family)